MMQEKINQSARYEWACRILLTIQLFGTLAGYLNYMHIKHQLLSPLIPRSMIWDLSEPAFTKSLLIGGIFFSALWLYFFRQKLASLIVSSVALGLIIWFLFFDNSLATYLETLPYPKH